MDKDASAKPALVLVLAELHLVIQADHSHDKVAVKALTAAADAIAEARKYIKPPT
ncbi:MAG TPA: hypothetical protein VFB22_15205 [Candidatus Baltobacteraceae bacterium]|nr:hypothetical protein [Candidatus Baltobacteraceae bacterium]